jgi:hypothetical protein
VTGSSSGDAIGKQLAPSTPPESKTPATNGSIFSERADTRSADAASGCHLDVRCGALSRFQVGRVPATVSGERG